MNDKDQVKRCNNCRWAHLGKNYEPCRNCEQGCNWEESLLEGQVDFD